MQWAALAAKWSHWHSSPDVLRCPPFGFGYADKVPAGVVHWRHAGRLILLNERFTKTRKRKAKVKKALGAKGSSGRFAEIAKR
jgi:hypothetical protein